MKVSLLLSAAALAAAAPATLGTSSASIPPATNSRLSQNGRQTSDLNSERSRNVAPMAFNDRYHMMMHAEAVSAGISNGSITEEEAPSAIQQMFLAATPTTTPSNVHDSMSKANEAFQLRTTSPDNTAQPDLMVSALGMMQNGFVSDDLHSALQQRDAAPIFINPPVPQEDNFYTKEGNAPFSVPEEQLRSAIQIPPTFTYGKKQPVIMSPGTGATGFETFGSNMGRLLSTTDHADPVYLSIPSRLLNDIQVNSEYVAYAIQYMNVMTKRDVAIVTWSQGSLNAQWAFKYWPSTRNVTTDHIPISPDYRGTKLARLLCSGNSRFNMIACTPAVLQQVYNSRMIQRLRQNGGDSSYVPTTTVYSQYDEIVQPQSGRGASGFIGDGNGAGASNTLLQDACRGQEGSGLFLHEGVLYSATAYALVIDALTHDGPGDFERVKSTCSQTTAPGITDGDVVQVEALVVLILFRILTFAPKAVQEPPIKDYATY